MSGPRIRGVFGWTAGSVPGFRYSSAMARAGTVWNDETLDAFLAAPAKAIPGTSKSSGVANSRDRAETSSPI
jgi:cytochrome c